MKFLIRDDDTCSFTNPDELRKCYEHIWDMAPVNLSVTPFRIPGDSHTVPDAFKGTYQPLALHENSELLSFLKEGYRDGKFAFAMHGYHHTKPEGIPEYVAESDLYAKTRKGKAYLEEVLGLSKLDTFVPPNNGIGREGLTAIVENGFNLVGIPPLLKSKFRKIVPSYISKYFAVKYFTACKKMAPPYVLQFPDHLEVGYYAVTPSQNFQSLLHGFSECRKRDGIFIFAVHYHAFTKRLKSGEQISDVLRIFLEMAGKSKNCQFITYKELWSSVT